MMCYNFFRPYIKCDKGEKIEPQQELFDLIQNIGIEIEYTPNAFCSFEYVQKDNERENEGTNFDSSSSSSSSSSSGGTGGKSRDALLNLAADQIGIKEDPAGSNKVKYNDWMWGEGTSGPDYPWCAAFVSWLFDQTYGDKAKDVMRGEKSASVATINSYFDAANATKKVPEPGDIIFYGSNHTGIVESVDKDKKSWIGIEGNTSGSDQSNGGEVARKEERFYDGANKYSRLTGFGRPDWEAGGSEDEDDEDETASGAVHTSGSFGDEEDEGTNEGKKEKKKKKKEKTKALVKDEDEDEGASGSGLRSGARSSRSSTTGQARTGIPWYL
jgi:hypothetical protein